MPRSKIHSVEALRAILADLQAGGRRVVFTNGCFDLLHPGHIRYLREAAALGDVLVVAVNSDASVHRLKGVSRPIQTESERAEILAALEMVGYVTIFDDDTPLATIRALKPDVLVKGGDWTPDRIVGRTDVEARGGTVRSLPFAPGYSTSALIRRITGGDPAAS
ncbi:MAG TPA: D-glycero-beta-D-manno-heptose 1-phosphate adenylyltransferase [Acidobacteriota bacterium]|nr:D-glycero-beta-D-manno-heptose 1-phosphate adenylyltransferase [Acidobacteriota bacterium]HNT99568.1 D-glycero-beta-D-manno-heptose 1-phosphate adenylyltransferase [Acidobacteriota bacterium]HPB26782.1 D-glycero-beta-D-manno-heptose 1-phosphate adenylyltransferase [Acidobacteriota bacterium]HQO24305.1 D-glycero-beta-D-manno-heptose 1-phosphate adenylyltransferase [Acidobacteriota bacterium]HQP73502.1 D-glycero-beta-D-manno-heptose 1-phosphate adenylyltransferase [Acidobacteriota bacterium]